MLSFSRLRRHRESPNERGFFTIWVLGLCVCVMFFGGISFDLWNAFSQRRQLTSMTDAAAIAGASQLDLDAFKQDPPEVKLDPIAARARAVDYLITAADTSNVKLTRADAVVTDTRVTAIASTRLNLTLTKLFTPKSAYDVTVTGVADPLCNDQGRNICRDNNG